jgi:hypothetical protein
MSMEQDKSALWDVIAMSKSAQGQVLQSRERTSEMKQLIELLSAALHSVSTEANKSMGLLDNIAGGAEQMDHMLLEEAVNAADESSQTSRNALNKLLSIRSEKHPAIAQTAEHWRHAQSAIGRPSTAESEMDEGSARGKLFLGSKNIDNALRFLGEAREAYGSVIEALTSANACFQTTGSSYEDAQGLLATAHRDLGNGNITLAGHINEMDR